MQSQSSQIVLQEAIYQTTTAKKAEIHEKVTLAKVQAAGRVARAKAALLEKKRQARLEVAVDQKMAIDEKARRLEERRQEHAVQYARKFEQLALSQEEGGDFSADRINYLVKSRMPSNSQHLSASSSAWGAAVDKVLTNATTPSRPTPMRAHDIALLAASARSAANLSTVLPPELRADTPHSASAPKL